MAETQRIEIEKNWGVVRGDTVLFTRETKEEAEDAADTKDISKPYEVVALPVQMPPSFV